jgi:uncharacterized membrane protein
VRSEVSRPHKTTHIIIFLHIWIIMFLNSKQENKILDWMLAGIPCIHCYLFLHQCNIDLFESFSNIWIMSHFEIIYLPLCCYLVLHSVHDAHKY